MTYYYCIIVFNSLRSKRFCRGKSKIVSGFCGAKNGPSPISNFVRLRTAVLLTQVIQNIVFSLPGKKTLATQAMFSIINIVFT